MDQIIFRNHQLLDEIQIIINKLLHNYDEILELYVQKNHTSKERVFNFAVHCRDQVRQRTDIWYQMRNACITASDIGSALGKNKYKSKKQVLMEKCGKRSFFGNFYTRWGNRFEPVATQIYEQLHNVKIYDATLLIHPIYPFIGASCDGFVIDELNNEGYLIEIKCPFKREPVDEIPTHYWEQPQTQMEVCKVNKCVFFDCKFEEYSSESAFLADLTQQFQGVMAEYINKKTNECFYIYPPNVYIDNVNTYNTIKENLLKEFEQINNDNNNSFILSRYIWWQLVKFSEIFLYRDRKWFIESLPKLKQFWKNINYLRETGIENLGNIIL